MRFVLLHHTGWPGHSDHYDLMLQFAAGSSDDDAVLKTFASVEDREPDGTPQRFQLINDHRRAYLAFEGALSGQRGSVKRIDEGELLDAPDFSLTEIRFRLEGRRLKGSFVFRRESTDCALCDDVREGRDAKLGDSPDSPVLVFTNHKRS